MQDIDPGNISTDKLSLRLGDEKKIDFSVLRLDKIHPVVSGNKWFKLRYYLEEAKKQRKQIIVTFGGAWSNHILATAAACRINQLYSVGIIRGEETLPLSDTLVQAKELGMDLVFSNRVDYRDKKIPEEFITSNHYLIPEGGYGKKGTEGAAGIMDLIAKESFTHICCAAGTGTMTAGLIKAALPSNHIVSIPVLKNVHDMEENILELVSHKNKSFTIKHEYHFGGYAKYNPALLSFMNEFYRETNIPTDFVYTAKLFYGVTDLAKNDFFPPGSKVLIIHSGGLQGNRSLDKGTLIF